MGGVVGETCSEHWGGLIFPFCLLQNGHFWPCIRGGGILSHLCHAMTLSSHGPYLPPIPLPSFFHRSGLTNCPPKPETRIGCLSTPDHLGSFRVVGSHVDCSDASTGVASLCVAKAPARNSRKKHRDFGVPHRRLDSFSIKSHHLVSISKFCTCAAHCMLYHSFVSLPLLIAKVHMYAHVCTH